MSGLNSQKMWFDHGAMRQDPKGTPKMLKSALSPARGRMDVSKIIKKNIFGPRAWRGPGTLGRRGWRPSPFLLFLKKCSSAERVEVENVI